METAIPFFREQGRGAGVVCLHSNASSSGQWRALSDLLSDRFKVIAHGRVLEGVGHMEPITHPKEVNALIGLF